MTVEKLNEGNELIALFEEKTGTKIVPKELYYNESWDWLMPVIEGISRMEFTYESSDGSHTLKENHYPRTFGMINVETGKPMFRFNCGGVFEADTLIEAAWLAVVDFIKQYLLTQNEGI